MKDYILRFIFLMILMMAMNVFHAQGQELPVSDTQDNGCTSRVPGSEEKRIP